VLSELAQSGYIVAEGERPGFGKETRGVNGGDLYFTDGEVAILTLANVWTHPLATLVRGPLGARIAQMVEHMLRWRLPQEGLARAELEFARLKERVAERVERIEHREPYAVHAEAPQPSSATPPATE